MRGYDPWGGINTSLANLGETFSDVGKQKIVQQNLQRKNSLADLQLQEGQLRLDELKRQRDIDAGARDLLDLAPNTPTQFAPPSPQKNMGGLQVDPSLTEIVKPDKQVNHDRLLLDYFKKNDKNRADEMEKILLAKFAALSKANPEEAVKWYSDVSGIDVKYKGSKTFIETKDGTLLAINQNNPNDKQLVHQGTPKSEYKSREFEKGDKKYFEESQDGGKTWKPVSEAPRYKPAATGGGGGRNGGIGKPLPPAALKMQQEAVDAIGTASSINADLEGVTRLIDSGKLDLGLISNTTGKVLNYAGISTESSRNLNTFKATLEKLRNDSLRLNKGVQTDGDAQRAWNELLSNINDKNMVKQRLAEIKEINKRAVTLQESNIENIRNNYGLAPLDTTKQKSVPGAIGKTKTRPPLSAIFGR